MRFSIWRRAMVLARHLRRANVRRLHIHFANSACTVGMLAARILRIPYSFTLHGPSDFMDTDQSRLGAKLTNAEFVACISNYARGKAMAHLTPDHHAKLHIIHCGGDACALYLGPAAIRPEHPFRRTIGRCERRAAAA